MTWKELKDFLEQLDEDQLAESVVYYSDRKQEVWHLQLYIAEEKMKDETGLSGDIKKNMPYLDFSRRRRKRGACVRAGHGESRLGASVMLRSTIGRRNDEH